ncbi:MAG: hypothetical protein AAAFM81_05000 [Pseudomonadota bacterium]
MDQLFYLLGVSAAVVFTTTAVLMLSDSVTVSRYQLPAARRQSLIQRLRLTNSVMLVCLTLMLVSGGLVFTHYDWFPWINPLALKLGLVCFGLAYLVLVSLTLTFRDLPGRKQLRRAENYGAMLIAIVLMLIAVVAIRRVPEEALTPAALGALTLSIMFGFFVASRAYLRGALIVGEHIVGHGSHPTREATLKRLLRRFRPFVVANSCLLITSVVLAIQL